MPHMKNHRIQPNYRTYPYMYKHTVKQFHSLQITASVLIVYFFIKVYFVCTHLKSVNLQMQLEWVPTTNAFIKKIWDKKKQKKKTTHKHHLIESFADPFFFLDQ